MGRTLAERIARNQTEYDSLNTEVGKWHSYNCTLLETLIGNAEELLKEYKYASGSGARISWGPTPTVELYQRLISTTKKRVRILESIIEKLELFKEVSTVGVATPSVADGRKKKGEGIFLVHGHDESAKQTAARFLETLGLPIVILHEKPSRGKTVIEKIEDYGNAEFAVVLLTPDDRCVTANGKTVRQPRPNVLLELGYFLGRLGRQRVCALLLAGTVLPTDFAGVIWVEMDAAGGWKLTLAKELKAAGLNVDLNLLG